jgi:hypothetical protein
MGFLFAYVCDLLEQLERPYLRDAPYRDEHLREYTHKATLTWFQKHRNRLDFHDTTAEVVTTMLRPGLWADRDYGWDAYSLEPLGARMLALKRQQYAQLQRWKHEPHTGDMATQVKRILDDMDWVSGRISLVPQMIRSYVDVIYSLL